MLSRVLKSILFGYIWRSFQYFSLIIILVLLLKVTEQNVRVETDLPLCRAESLKARHKSCFLRPDSGPCRADIIQWYFDVKQNKCYEFFWGGCQGNGNRFETKTECYDYCWLNNSVSIHIPYFCDLPFEYGNCFGHYQRWHWDKYYKICKRRIYSGCGGNQNNFDTLEHCRSTCMMPAPMCRGAYRDTIHSFHVTTKIHNNLRKFNLLRKFKQPKSQILK